MAYIGNNLTVQQYAPQIAYFNGTGSATAFTLPIAVVSAAQIIVAIENVIQNPSSAFTVSGTTLTFTSAPPSGTNNIWVEYTSLQTNTIAPSVGTVNSAQLGIITTIPTTSANTATLPAATGTVMVSGNMPAFSAYKSASQTGLSSGTQTKITFDVEAFDTNSNFASSRFTPTIAGYYLINAGADIFATAMTTYTISIYKNGTVYHQNGNANTSGDAQVSISGIVYCNGTTDYIEIYGLGAGTGVGIYGDNTLRYTWFSGSMLRTA
jgi:hypothetical protein